MTELKGKDKLNKAISKELKPFGISSANLSDEYAYYFENESVAFKLTSAIEDRWFNEFIAERFNYVCDVPFVLSLLHEIGHHKANDEIDGAIYEFCMAEKERISEEIMATQWEVNYAKKHPKKIKNMWERMRANILVFYAENGLADETEDL